jgi:hypothetical protein
MVEPSRNVTVPVAPVVTAAEKVIAWPGADGFTDEANETVAASFPTVTCVGGEVSVPLVAVFVAVTVIVSVPTGRDDTVKVAEPPTIGAVPIAVPPL